MNQQFNSETLASVAGTLIGDVLCVTKQQKEAFLLGLKKTISTAIDKKEIGELNNLEMAFFTCAKNRKEKINSICDQVFNGDTKDNPELRKKFSLIKTEIKILEQTAWSLIKIRIGSEEDTSLQICADGKIVSCKPEPDFEVIHTPFGMGIIISM